jgi:mono/diheme cytochrome c family protein
VIVVSAGGVLAATTKVQDPGEERARTLAVEAGRNTYRQFCAPCHGQQGKGDGPVAAMLLTKPINLTQVNRRHNGVFPEAQFEAMLTLTRIQTAAHGSGPMPIWGPVFQSIDSSATLARARVVNLLAYLESIQE